MTTKHGVTSFGITTKWIRSDKYHYYEKVSRWTLLVWLLKGRMHLCWFVPATKKDKLLHLKGTL